MKLLASTFLAATLLSGELTGRDQRAPDKPAPQEDRAAKLEQARQAIEARLTQGTLKGVRLTASDVKRVRRITIDVPPMNKNPRDDASTALSMAWQPALQHITAFEEIAVRVGSNYSVTCRSRAFADTSISLWREGLARTCREARRGADRPRQR